MKTQTEQSQSGHTPGPWKQVDGFIVGRFNDGQVHDICDPRCAPAEPDLLGEMEANARLIASAPETAAELERVKAVNLELAEALQHALARGEVQADTLRFQARYENQEANIAHAKECDRWNAVYRAALAKSQGGVK